MGIQTDEIKAVNERIEKESIVVQTINAEVSKAIVGQQYLMNRLLVGLLANGHILIEGVPGLAKTYAVRTLAAAIRTRFQRIQLVRMDVRHFCRIVGALRREPEQHRPPGLRHPWRFAGAAVFGGR